MFTLLILEMESYPSTCYGGEFKDMVASPSETSKSPESGASTLLPKLEFHEDDNLDPVMREELDRLE